MALLPLPRETVWKGGRKSGEEVFSSEKGEIEEIKQLKPASD